MLIVCPGSNTTVLMSGQPFAVSNDAYDTQNFVLMA
jgi:hypothetical protein